MMQPDDPPFLTVGTEVSAKYKGAFCEAKVNKVVKVVKIKVTFKQSLGSAVLSDEALKGSIKVGSQVKALHPEKNQHVDAIINKIQDCSQYTVVFDDGDITTLRRSSLCLKSGRHFAESETLDQLPLTHPEHFGTPVVGGRRGRRSRPNQDSDASSEDEENVYRSHRSQREEWQSDIGKVICVEIGDKKKQRDNWFPGLVVAPTAQDSVKIETKKDYLVRSFQDGRYYTVPKKEATDFSKEIGQKVSQSALRTAVDKALLYIDRDELPPHWDRDLLFGVDISEEDSEKETDTDSSDDEPREEKDHFVAQLYKYMEECGAPINKGPTIGNKDLDLYKLYKVVHKLGGFNRVMNQNQWKLVANKMNLQLGSQAGTLAKSAYKRYLQSFEDFYRKLGCTMVSNPRGSRMRHRSGRSLIRDCDRTPRQKQKGTESCDSTEEESEKKEDFEEERDEISKVEDLSFSVQRIPESRREACQTRKCSTPLSVRSISPISKERPIREVRESKINKVETKNAKPLHKENFREDEVRTRSASAIPPPHKIEEDDEDNSQSTSEEEVECIPTRSLRNREDPKDKDEQLSGSKTVATKRHKVVQEHQRSTSCNSTSSGTSSSSSVSSSSGTSSSGSSTAESKSSDKGKKSLSLEDKKRGRKKKLENEPEQPMGRPILPAHVPINIGDKLRVLYGPTNKESKVTYEAKVLKIDEEDGQKVFFVHYNGWNIRYDEWVFRQRIAQNLTWCQARLKKGRAAVTKELKEREKKKDPPKTDRAEKECDASVTPRAGSASKRNKSASVPEKDHKDPERESTTPSMTRSSSRNESKDERIICSETTPDRRRSTRRNLGISKKDLEDSFSEDFDSGAESNNESQRLKTSSLPPPSKPLPSAITCTEQKEASNGEDIKGIDNNSTPIKIETSDIKPSALNTFPSPFGKDIDMKAIESEMKGLDRPIKKEEGMGFKEMPGQLLTTVIPGSLTVIEKKVHDPKKPFDSPVKKLEIPVKLVPALEVMGQIKPLPISGLKKDPFLEDDIYEFKEPEPFEPGEIRSRKESRTSRSTGSNSGDDVELEVKSKKQAKIWKDEKSLQEGLDSEEGDDMSLMKNNFIENVESSPIKIEPCDPDAKLESKETPSKESKKELRDYSRKVEPKELLGSREEKKKETPKKCEKKISTLLEPKVSLPPDFAEPLPEIEIWEGQGDSLGKEQKPELSSELSSDAILFGASVILSPKKPVTKKDQSPNAAKLDLGYLKSHSSSEVSPSKSADVTANVCPKDAPKVLAAFPIQPKQKPPSQPLERCLPSQVLSKPISQTGHILPQIIMPPVDSRTLAKPIPKLAPETTKVVSSLASSTKSDDRESKMMPFSQRQQHIFPHLLNRSEPAEERNKVKEISAPKSPILAIPNPQIVSVSASPDVASSSKLSEMDKSKCESSVEESIEAVVLRARQDQMEGNPDKIPGDHKPPDKRRRNPIRSKKILSREFLAHSSEDSDSDSKSDKTEPYIRQKWMKGGSGFKGSPSKRISKLNSLGEKKLIHCDDEERANDADEEDNETSSAPLQNLCREALRRRLEPNANQDEIDCEYESDKEKRSLKKKRRSSTSFKRSDDIEETGLGDLLCKETIPPGSPMPQESIDVNIEPTGVKQEMPFASVPTGSCFNKRPTPPVTSQSQGLLQPQGTLAPPLQFPPSICIQPVPQGRTHFESNVPQVSPPTVTITSIPMGSRVSPISESDKIPISSVPFEKPVTQKAVPSVEPSASKPVPSASQTSNDHPTSSGSNKMHNPMQVHHFDQQLMNERSSLNTLVKASLSESGKLKPDEGQANHSPPAAPPSAIPAIDNTPPTTPESIVSNFSDSPRRENDGGKAYDASKSGHSCSSEIDYDNKMDNFSEDSTTMDSNSSSTKPRKRSISAAHEISCEGTIGVHSTHSHSEGWDTEDGNGASSVHSKKRRKSLTKVKAAEEEEDEELRKAGVSFGTCPSRRQVRHPSRGSSKGEEELDNHGLNALSLVACASGRSRFNFCQEIDPDTDASKRIAILQNRMQELKRTYMQVKSELASVERRRKKLKKKETEGH